MKLVRNSLFCALALGLAGAATAQAPAYKPEVTLDANGVRVVRGAEMLGTSYPDVIRVNMADLPPAREWKPGDPLVEIPRQHWESKPNQAPVPVNPTDLNDPLVPLQFNEPLRAQRAFGTPSINVAGSTSQASPPDPTGDVGTSHFVQGVNGSGGSEIRIYRKSDGSFVRSFSLVSLGGTGACATGLGDPIIVFDELANRWVLTEFSNQAGRSLCVYVSDTDNLEAATVTWYKYTFTMPAFPDYPKYGVWSDAYYVGANEGGTSGQRPLYAMDRAKMLAGLPATFQRITIPNLTGFGFQMTTPADHDGRDAPPAGARGIFLRHRDDESHNAGSNNPTQDFLELYQLAVDFTTPANTALTGPLQIPIAEFSSNLNGLTAFNAFPQPGGQKLDPLREPVMNRLAYRNFGSYESLVGNMVTDIDGNDTGGIRWFELRRTGGIAQPWTLHQEGTWAGAAAPQDGIDRWMAGISMDESGNIALAYSMVRQSPALFASLGYVGREAGDPLGTMTTAETTLIAGVGNHPNERWGDYFQMGVDPVDGCTFWFTGEYMPSTSKGTRIGAFRFDNCGTPTFSLNGNNLSQEVCTAAGTASLTPVTLNIGSVSGFTNPVSLAFANALPTGFSGAFAPTTVTPPGSSTLNMSVANTAAAGSQTIGINGTSGATTKLTNLNVSVVTAAPGVPALTAPVDNAVGQSLSPVLSWSATAQAKSYVVEVSTDPAFATVQFTQTVSGGGTSTTVTPALSSNTRYYWRVRSNNVCGTSTNSPVFSFKTAPALGDCDDTTTPATLFSSDVEGDVSGWATTGSTGASTWAVSTARPSSPTKSWLAIDIATTSDQRLISPAVVLPTGQNPLSLSFQNDVNMEERTSGGCWDGGLLEISSDNGSTWTQATSALMNTPYTGALNDGPANGLQAWCGTIAYRKTIVDLNAYAGQTVRFRFRASTDGSQGDAPLGWFVDDIKVQSCVAGQPDRIFANGFESTP
ncbi:hypothetical protein DFR29_102115 [Tahibacter aquaticus]|uniref:Fibronectin type-III domain-containing protein n=1 Tax=Tahibacter aquaticus TaxID=520092 RepID=A0A4R6Z6S7_9GAMM|nr:fibronectin type III domain-containing protein [Tahibacter aquaticus]TDR47455.1 hypothetical protein DFR29_102115 [Tahibacter aquaticus]